jgi:hypothetical protein
MSYDGKIKKGEHRSVSTQFKPGHVPANKGKKLTAEVYEKAKPTMFTKGHKPHNTTTVGDIRMRKDMRGVPYFFIKIADQDWRHLHRVVWEAHHGNIPKGCRIHFKDRNTLNCVIENLELLTGDAAMKRVQIHRLPDEIKELIRLNSKLKRKIAEYGKKQNV